MLTSANGIEWTPRTNAIPGGLLDIEFAEGRFHTVAAGAIAAVSTNGIDWEHTALKTSEDPAAVAFGAGLWVVAGYKSKTSPNGMVFTSPDGQQWSARDSKLPDNLFAAKYGLGLFLVAGQDGWLATSPDGVEWTPRESQTSGFIWDIAFNGTHFAAASQWGRVLTSPDGIAWTRHETDLTWHLKSAAFGANTFVLVGWNGQIVQSDPVASSPAIQLQDPAHGGAQFSFQFNSEAGRDYEVEVSTDCNAWSSLGSVKATGPLTQVQDVNASQGPRFYRLVQP